MTVSEIVSHLNMLPHPEGGYYKETYRSTLHVTHPLVNDWRSVATAIYFLIEKNNFSAFHKIKSDEVWHFYAGDALEVIELDENGNLIYTSIGSNLQAGEVFQYLVKAGRWFGSRVKAGGHYSLVGCTVAPGFEFKDFELANGNELIALYPQHVEVIKALTR